MKKLSLVFAVAIMMTAIFVSCNKKDNLNQPEKTYAKYVSGEIIVQNGDVTLKSDALIDPVTEKLYMYKGVYPGPFTLVDGTEFLTGSAPATFWATSGNNPGTFLSTQTVYSNFTPAIPVRMVAQTLNAANVPAYLGIFDVTPTSNGFAVTIFGKRLGDVLTINTDALTALPGYSSMSFAVTYNRSIIDVAGTVQSSPATTATNWPVYSYSSSPSETVILDATKNQNNRTVYKGLDAKITGTISITITVDGNPIIVTTPASILGQGMEITLSTSKVGWYDSGNMVIHNDDIIVTPTNIAVN